MLFPAWASGRRINSRRASFSSGSIQYLTPATGSRIVEKIFGAPGRSRNPAWLYRVRPLESLATNAVVSFLT
jgi:hypothetical protein